MRLTRPSTPTVVIVAGFILINLIALNWTAKFFRHSFNNSLLVYGAQMPNLDGRGYSKQLYVVPKNVPTLVLYIHPHSVKGRSVSLLKFCEILRQQYPDSFSPILITAGILPEAQELLQDKLISYPVLNDDGGKLGARLGLNDEEGGTFFFGKNGTCELASRQAADVDDLRQLLMSQNTNVSGLAAAAGFKLEKGKPLPGLKIIDARSLKPFTTSELSSKQDQLWVLFLADCFACGAPSTDRYLSEFAGWQTSAKDIGSPPIIVFDSAFLRSEVLTGLDRFKISLPVYLSNEELTPFSKLVLANGRAPNQPLLVRTDKANALTRLSLIKSPSDSLFPSTENSKVTKAPITSETTARYSRIFDSTGLDLYDVDSYGGSYYVTDRSRNAVLVLDDRFQLQRTISGIGSAPGQLFHPGQIAVAGDGVIYVQDGGNERVESFRADGTFLGAFSIGPYAGFAAGNGGVVYLGQPETGALVSVYSPDGKIVRSFGKLKSYSDIFGQSYSNLEKQYGTAMNRVRLSVDRDGDVLVSFMLVPILQKYTQGGDLIFETHLEGSEIDKLRSSTGHLTMSMDGFPEDIIALEAVPRPNGEIDVILTDGSIYVLDQSGRKLRVLHPAAETEFTPEMTGITPAGDPVVIGLIPRNCYRVSGV